MGLLAGSPLWISRLEAGSAGGWDGVRRAPRPVGVMATSWCGPVRGVTRPRPPAVAVIGLRRSGRTGNGEGPPRAHRARLPARDAQSHRFRFAAARHGYLRRQAYGALRA